MSEGLFPRLMPCPVPSSWVLSGTTVHDDDDAVFENPFLVLLQVTLKELQSQLCFCY